MLLLNPDLTIGLLAELAPAKSNIIFLSFGWHIMQGDERVCQVKGL